MPAPQVDDHLAVDDDADRTAELVVVDEVRAERIAHAGEPRVDVALDVRHRAILACGVRAGVAGSARGRWRGVRDRRELALDQGAVLVVTLEGERGRRARHRLVAAAWSPLAACARASPSRSDAVSHAGASAGASAMAARAKRRASAPAPSAQQHRDTIQSAIATCCAPPRAPVVPRVEGDLEQLEVLLVGALALEQLPAGVERGDRDRAMRQLVGHATRLRGAAQPVHDDEVSVVARDPPSSRRRRAERDRPVDQLCGSPS